MKKLLLIISLSLGVLVSFGQSLPNVATPSHSTSTSTAYVFNISSYGSSYNDKIAIVKFLIDNTGASTVNINGIGTKALRVRSSGVWIPLIAGDLSDSTIAFLKYDQASGYMRVVDMFREGGGTWGTITGTLSSQTDLQSALDAKQATLVSGTNIKTVNSNSLVGSGNIAVGDALVANPLSQFASTTSSQFAGVISDEVGAGKVQLSDDVFNRQTADYPLVLSDKGKTIEMNVGSANNLTVPLNSTVAYDIGTRIKITQYGAGLTSVVATGGVTIRSNTGTLVSPGQYASMILVKVGTDEWYLFNGTGGSFESGTYTPTLSNTANVAASTAYLCTYVRIDNTVIFSGRVDIDPTTTTTDTQLGITIPIPSAFTTANQAGGVAAAPGFVSDCAAILSDATNDRLLLQYKCTDVTNHSYYFTVTYQRIP